MKWGRGGGSVAVNAYIFLKKYIYRNNLEKSYIKIDPPPPHTHTHYSGASPFILKLSHRH